ncbi:preprotein translocase subunit SecA [Lactococcus termiticola]|uniref:Protein translocase subunit SecA n=1 Tax=Lactococcus termiticola TaxID=2169526 RepID=A0A2R5HE52_9LACT|nr:preprotein translocase subunit SecA [Lactococcus termiticola]GBG96353.1 preprotein translocase subunit SecA [Lactococcus termiticola]
MLDKKKRKYRKLLKAVRALAPKYLDMTDAELQMQTQLFRERLDNGESLEKLLPEAYAVCIEADKRVLGLDPYDVQVLAGIALFFGTITEMKTGEGKTLTATMPTYLRGLAGPGNFVVTSNEYLAWRDAENVGKVYRFLGLSVAVGAQKSDFDQDIDKKEAYNSDIVYTTHSALGFDYLLDNLAVTKEKQYLHPFKFVLIDEVDSILLDMAQTPLIISGAPKLQSNLSKLADKFIKSLVEDEEYELSEDKKLVWFLEDGIAKAEDYFSVKDILSEENAPLYRRLVLALKANHVHRANRDYVVYNGEILLLDEMNGRKLEGTKLQGGMHQALEAKEGLDITEETRSMGSVTYQNLFKMFEVLSGMTGTAMTDADELRDTYDVDVMAMPTHRPILRKDHDEKVFAHHKMKILDSLDLVKAIRETERPILIATGSVSKSYLYSMLLLDHRIPHSLLNASTASKEAQIVEEAGKRGAVTVATAMAGRGTDIKLDDFSREHGGLVVIGTENMTSERIDNQLRGRSGRQGEPGDSYFFSSLEDQIVVENAPDWVRKYRKKLESDSKYQDREEHLTRPKYARLVKKSQKNKKNQDVQSRKETLDYDDITSVLRNRIYDARNMIMEADSQTLEFLIIDSVNHAVTDLASKKEGLTGRDFNAFVTNNIDYGYKDSPYAMDEKLPKKAFGEQLFKLVEEKSVEVLANLQGQEQIDYYRRVVILRAIDSLWIDLADGLVQLKSIVSNRTWAQHQPLYEFQKEAERYFYETREKLRVDIMRNYLLSELFRNPDGSVDVEYP